MPLLCFFIPFLFFSYESEVSSELFFIISDVNYWGNSHRRGSKLFGVGIRVIFAGKTGVRTLEGRARMGVAL